MAGTDWPSHRKTGQPQTEAGVGPHYTLTTLELTKDRHTKIPDTKHAAWGWCRGTVGRRRPGNGQLNILGQATICNEDINNPSNAVFILYFWWKPNILGYSFMLSLLFEYLLLWPDVTIAPSLQPDRPTSFLMAPLGMIGFSRNTHTFFLWSSGTESIFKIKPGHPSID